MNEATYWRQRYEMLMATFTDAVRAAIDTHNTPRYLADAESYNLGKLHGTQETREECAELCNRMAARCNDIRKAALEMAAENISANKKQVDYESPVSHMFGDKK